MDADEQDTNPEVLTLTWGISGAFPNCILHLRGMLCNHTLEIFSPLIGRLEAMNVATLVVDVSELHWLDDAGLERLLVWFQSSKQAKRTFTVTGLQGQPEILWQGILADPSSPFFSELCNLPIQGLNS